jgi:hypothetical protein
MRTNISSVCAAVLLLSVAAPAIAEPDRGPRCERGYPAAKMDGNGDRSERRGFDGDRRRGSADPVVRVRDRHDGERATKMDRSDGDRFDGDHRRGSADVDVRVRDRHYGDRRWRGRSRDFVVRHGHRHSWGGVTFYLSDGYYYGECGWLKRRAIRTDNPIWWSRYRRCRDFS